MLIEIEYLTFTKDRDGLWTWKAGGLDAKSWSGHGADQELGATIVDALGFLNGTEAEGSDVPVQIKPRRKPRKR